MNQNFYNSSGFDQTQPPQFPVIHPPPQEMSIKIFHDHENVINSVQTFLRKFNRYSFFETTKELAEYINTPGWNRLAFYDDDEDDDDSNDEFSSTDNDSFSIDNIDYVEASPLDSELVSSEVMEIVIPECPPTNRSDFTHEEFADELDHIISPSEYDCFYFWNLPDPVELMYVLNSRIRENLSATTRVNLPVENDYSPLLAYVVWIFLAYLTYPVIPPYLHPFGNEDTIFNPGITINCFCSFKPGLSHRYGAFKKFNTHHYEAFYFDDDHVKEISSCSPTTQSDISLSEYDSFIFDLCPPSDRSDFYEFTDELCHIISPPEYDCFYFRNLPDPGELISIFNSRIRENPSVTTRVNSPVEDDHSPLLAYVVWIFLAYLTYPVIPPYLHPFENEDTIFDPGITINHFYSSKPGLSHQCGAFKKFNTHRSHLNECPMIINGKNTPILDFEDQSLHVLRPSRLCAQAQSGDDTPFHKQAYMEYTQLVFCKLFERPKERHIACLTRMHGFHPLSFQGYVLNHGLTPPPDHLFGGDTGGVETTETKIKTHPLDQTEGQKEGSLAKKLSYPEIQEEPSHTIDESKVQQHQEFDTGNNDEQPADKEVSKADWFKKTKRPPTLDPDWNKRQHVNFLLSHTWISQVAHAKEPTTSFDELLNTPIDFSTFCGTLNDVQTALHDIAKGIRMEYLSKRKWNGLDKRRSRVMIKDIKKHLFQRRLIRNLKKFVSGRECGNYLRLLERTI
nr:hypothetical protein [Tanacetum cinerariifolium]